MKKRVFRIEWLMLLLAGSALPAAVIEVESPEALQSALVDTRAGDTLRLAPGVWHGLDLTIGVRGTEASPVIVEAAEPGRTVLTGPTAIRLAGRHIIIRGLHFQRAVRIPGAEGLVVFRDAGGQEALSCRLTGLFFEDCNPPDPAEDYPWVRVYGRDHRIDHCRFAGQDHKGRMIQIRTPASDLGHRIDHNHFVDRLPGRESNGYEVLQIGLSRDSRRDARVVVEANWFERCDGETEIISSKSGGNHILRNHFLACSGTVTLRHGTDNIVEDNVFDGRGKPGSGGVRVVDSGHVVRSNTFMGLSGRTGGVVVLYCGIPDSPLNGYFPAHRVRIENNRFHGHSGNAVYLTGGYGRHNRVLLPEGIQLVGNTFGRPSSGGVVAVAGNPPGLQVEGNTYAPGVELGLAGNAGWRLVEGELPGPPPGKGVPMRHEVGPSWHADLPALLLWQETPLQELVASRDPVPEAWRRQLLDEAQAVLAAGQRYSVTFNDRLPPSGNRNDYYSTGPYWWPDPDSPDGLPYIRIDGKFNPERDRVSDREPLHRMVREVRLLALAGLLARDSQFGEWAAELVRTWFLDPETRMRPNLRHAQAIPGVTEGRGTGIIDAHPFAELVDALLLLEHGGHLDPEETGNLRAWFQAYGDWLLHSPNGVDEREALNNHGTAYDLQLAAVLRYTGQDSTLVRYLWKTTVPRLEQQIEADGRQPLELSRTRTWSYCTENLEHFFKLGLIARTVGVDLFHEVPPGGGGLRTALDFLVPHACQPETWPYPQETEWQHGFIRNVLSVAAGVYDGTRYADTLDCLPDPAADPLAFLLRPGS